jgi:hypothetical protein
MHRSLGFRRRFEDGGPFGLEEGEVGHGTLLYN